ncbi:hypothetical protein [Arenimonas sp.]|uniref:hypothetical protein n=1 Tax=Arenimonas sp. TaxID=1872635 RepID=UPI002E371556|nr:hypothetical protein [Arenimonas sp.]HEX4854244.1 hypothetical protein [Arenimonas sp.]
MNREKGKSMSPKYFALVVACIVGLALLRFVEAGYLLSTLPSEAEMEQKAGAFVEQMRPLLPEGAQAAEGTIHYLSLAGEQRVRSERRDRALANLQFGFLALLLLSLLAMERRAGQAAVARAAAVPEQSPDSTAK